MRILYAFLCEHAHQHHDERLDARGIVRRLYAPGFPAQHRATLVLAVEWNAGEQGEMPFKIDLLDPDGSPVMTASGSTSVTEGHDAAGPPPLTRLVMPIEQMIFPAPGRYDFELQLGGEKHRLAPLYLLHDDGTTRLHHHEH